MSAESEAFQIAFFGHCGTYALLRTQLGGPKPSKDPKLDVQGAPRTATWRSQTPQNHAPVYTRTQIQENHEFPLGGALEAVRVPLLGTFWSQLGRSWLPFDPKIDPKIDKKNR